jgi:phage nucleotide-binding protein
MKLTDALAKSGISAIVYGEAGIGKTHFVGTLPGKTLLIAAEKNGINTLKKFPAEVQDRLELLFLPPITADIDKTSAAYNKFFDELMIKEYEQDNIVLDSATELANLLLILKTDPAKNGGIPTMKNYGEVQFCMKRYLRILRDIASVKGKNIIIIALESELVINQTADAAMTSKTHPALSGKKLAPEAEGLFDIVAHLEKRSDGNRVFRLESNEQFVAKDRFGRAGCRATGEALLYPESTNKNEKEK